MQDPVTARRERLFVGQGDPPDRSEQTRFDAAIAAGDKIQIVTPPQTLLIENPLALTYTGVTNPSAEAFYKYLFSTASAVCLLKPSRTADELSPRLVWIARLSVGAEQFGAPKNHPSAAPLQKRGAVRNV